MYFALFIYNNNKSFHNFYCIQLQNRQSQYDEMMRTRFFKKSHQLNEHGLSKNEIVLRKLSQKNQIRVHFKCS